MSDKTYRVDIKGKNLAVQLGDAVQDIFARKTKEQVEKRLARVVDREIGKSFYYIALDIYHNDFDDLRPYLPKPWRPYSESYKKQKLKHAGHLDWFKYGAYSPGRAGEEQLADEFSSVDHFQLLRLVGHTSVRVAPNKKSIKISVAPHLRFSTGRMENRFSSLLSDTAMYKLQNRRRAYRALIGPEFQYMLTERLPAAIQHSLARL